MRLNGIREFTQGQILVISLSLGIAHNLIEKYFLPANGSPA